MTTKEQERKALEQIKKILGTLDPDGWVNIAFDGVVEQAEENINNDFACSYKAGCEYRDEKLAKSKEENEMLRKGLEAANKRIDALLRSSVCKDDLRMVSSILQYHNQNKYLKEIEECNSAILEYAENPECDDFRTAVSRRKLAQRMSGELGELVARIETARCAE